MSLVLRAIAAEAETDDFTFVRLPGHELDLEATPALFSGEQSNSSVLFGEDSVLKVFRKITRGENPDITTHRVLTEAGSPHVAALYGWIEATTDGRGADPSRDAPAVPPHRERRLGDRPRQRPGPVLRGRPACRRGRRRLRFRGGPARDRAGRGARAAARRVRGRTVDAGVVAGQMDARLDQAIDVVPELGEHADRLRGAYAALAELGEHLGAADPRRPPPRPDAAHHQGLEAASTSRASRRSRWPNGCSPTARGATWPGCCDPSTTPRTRWPARCPRTTPTSSRSASTAPRSGRPATRRPSSRRTPAIPRSSPARRSRTAKASGRGVRRGQDRLRVRLRGPQPALVAADPAAQRWRRWVRRDRTRRASSTST